MYRTFINTSVSKYIAAEAQKPQNNFKIIEQMAVSCELLSYSFKGLRITTQFKIKFHCWQ